MFSRPASRCSSDIPPSGCWATSARFTDTTSAVLLSTSGVPTSSRILPRTGGTITVLVWSCAAALAYARPVITCRYHSRPPRAISSAATST